MNEKLIKKLIQEKKKLILKMIYYLMKSMKNYYKYLKKIYMKV